jgi:hypothetical protein
VIGGEGQRNGLRIGDGLWVKKAKRFYRNEFAMNLSEQRSS